MTKSTQKSAVLVVVSRKCRKCTEAARTVRYLLKDRPDIEVEETLVSSPEAVDRNVTAAPSVLLLKNGAEIRRVVGCADAGMLQDAMADVFG